MTSEYEAARSLYAYMLNEQPFNDATFDEWYSLNEHLDVSHGVAWDVWQKAKSTVNDRSKH